MSDITILIIALILYGIAIGLYFVTKSNVLLVASSLLWFIPIFLVPNVFIITFSSILFVATLVFTFFSERSEW